MLRDYFISDFEKVRDYWSFAVIRDPLARFPSSVSQRFIMYRKQPIRNHNTDQIREEVERIINFLSKQPRDDHLLPPEFIHFQKQADYVRVDGDTIIDTLYPIDNLSELFDDIAKRVGSDLSNLQPRVDSPDSNRTYVHRFRVTRPILESIRPVTRLARRIFPGLATRGLEQLIYVPRDRRLDSVFSSDYVKDFIRSYYRDDLELWNKVSLSSGKPCTATDQSK